MSDGNKIGQNPNRVVLRASASGVPQSLAEAKGPAAGEKKYWFVSYIYFFINPTFFLNSSLLLTSILSPLFYLWLRKLGHKRILTYFFVVAAPFMFFQLRKGVELSNYATSLAVAITLYVTVYAFYIGVNKVHGLSHIFERLITTNFAISIFGLLLLLTPWASLMWISNTITVDVDETLRFKMLTYEPSYYSTLLAPLVLFAFWRFVSLPSFRSFGRLLAVVGPLMMSFSFGVIGGLIVALIIIACFSLKSLWRHKLLVAAVSAFAVLAIYLLQDTLVWTRLVNVASGQDTSANARMIESYFFAFQIAAEKSIWWGVGFGQVKLLDYLITSWTGGRLICAVAENFALFGLVGLALRFFAEAYLFFHTRVYSNRFRLSLFLFIFIYQFTGSFTTNLAEYVIWILAFSPIFPEFDRRPATQTDRRVFPSLAVPAAPPA